MHILLIGDIAKNTKNKSTFTVQIQVSFEEAQAMIRIDSLYDLDLLYISHFCAWTKRQTRKQIWSYETFSYKILPSKHLEVNSAIHQFNIIYL